MVTLLDHMGSFLALQSILQTWNVPPESSILIQTKVANAFVNAIKWCITCHKEQGFDTWHIIESYKNTPCQLNKALGLSKDNFDFLLAAIMWKTSCASAKGPVMSFQDKNIEGFLARKFVHAFFDKHVKLSTCGFGTFDGEQV